MDSSGLESNEKIEIKIPQGSSDNITSMLPNNIPHAPFSEEKKSPLHDPHVITKEPTANFGEADSNEGELKKEEKGSSTHLEKPKTIEKMPIKENNLDIIKEEEKGNESPKNENKIVQKNFQKEEKESKNVSPKAETFPNESEKNKFHNQNKSNQDSKKETLKDKYQSYNKIEREGNESNTKGKKSFAKLL